eukprot:9308278-Alexandrium_andersonii.AAC.1
MLHVAQELGGLGRLRPCHGHYQHGPASPPIGRRITYDAGARNGCRQLNPVYTCAMQARSVPR